MTDHHLFFALGNRILSLCRFFNITHQVTQLVLSSARTSRSVDFRYHALLIRPWSPCSTTVAPSPTSSHRAVILDDDAMNWRGIFFTFGEGNGTPTPVLLPGNSHGRRSLVGYSPWGREDSDTTEQLHFHFSFSCIGEGNGNPLQCSCLENPRDGGAWWAAVYGVAQSRTRLMRLSSSSSSSILHFEIGARSYPTDSPITQGVS